MTITAPDIAERILNSMAVSRFGDLGTDLREAVIRRCRCSLGKGVMLIGAIQACSPYNDHGTTRLTPSAPDTLRASPNQGSCRLLGWQRHNLLAFLYKYLLAYRQWLPSRPPQTGRPAIISSGVLSNFM